MALKRLALTLPGLEVESFSVLPKSMTLNFVFILDFYWPRLSANQNREFLETFLSPICV